MEHHGKRKLSHSSSNKWKWENRRKDGASPTNIHKKFRWYDGQGRQLTAGGLLPYDDNGIWVIGEKKTKEGPVEWTDPGGKYKFEDCDIYTTISREFSEELYYSTTISKECILDIKNTHIPTYVNGHQNKPVYICYIVHMDELEKYNVKLDVNLFLEYRRKTLSSNPDVPPEYYSSVELKHIPFDEIENVTLSYRLKRILKYGTLSNRLSSISVLNRSITPDTSEEVSSEEEEIDNIRDKLIIKAPVPIKASSPPIVFDIEKACSLVTLGTSPPLLVG